MDAKLELITPALAKEFLLNAKKNRNLSERQVRRFADDMSEGRWQVNGQSIVIDVQGQLIDGQHRLSAILLSQKAQNIFVVRGVATAAMETMDTGKARTLADVLALEGYKNTSNIATTARYCWNYAAGVSTQYTPTKMTLLDFVKHHRDQLEFGVDSVEARRQNVFPRSVLSALIALSCGGNNYKWKVVDFLDGIITGAGLPLGDPRLTYRNWAIRLRSQHAYAGNSVSLPMFGAGIRAWNAFVQDRTLENIRFPLILSRHTLMIEGFNTHDWPDVPDVKEESAEAARENLKKARKASVTLGPGTQVIAPINRI
jgi:hypothetical protein